MTSKAALRRWVKKCRAAKSVCYDTETTGLDAFTVDLVGHALAVEENGRIESCYIPTGHTYPGVPYQLTNGVVLAELRPILEDASKPKILSNAQYDMLVLNQPRYSTQILNVHDTVYMAYVFHGDTVFSHGMDLMALIHLGIKTIKFDDVVKPALGIETFADVDLKIATEYSAEDTAVTLMLAKVLQAKLRAEGLWEVYNDIDRPLLPALFDMKRTGVLIDAERCGELAKEWTAKCEELKDKAHEIAGRKFALGSPKQLAQVLYEDRKLPIPAYTASNAPATDKFALDKLSGDPLVDVLQEWRKLDKLRSTYAVALPTKIHVVTGRVHTDWKVTRTSTGRLASANPNLQNISTRSVEGRQMRGVFIAPPKKVLIGCDFSQIELRMAGHLSGEPVLVRAYRDGKDVHASTAANIKHVPIELVDEGFRATAKTANFLALYQGGYRQLVIQAKIPEAEAYLFLQDYWESLPVLRDYIDEVKFQAAEDGYVETLFGRRVFLPRIRSRDREVRSAQERLSVSGKIQGTAADLIRLAMTKVHCAISVFDEAKLILSVHDELVVECLERDAEQVRDAVKSSMETAADGLVEWSLPIVAAAKIGKTWLEIH